MNLLCYKERQMNYLLASLKDILPSDFPVYSGPGFSNSLIHCSKLFAALGRSCFNSS